MLFYVLVLSAAASMDAFATGMAYGVEGIRVPLGSLIVISIVTVAFTAVGLGGTHLVGRFVDTHAATVAGAFLLMALGGYRLLLGYLVQNDLSEHATHPHAPRELKISVGALVIEIMARSAAADLDRSRHISGGEAVLLSLALGIDNFVATLGAGFGNGLPFYAPLAMGVVQAAFLVAALYGSEWLSGRRVKLRASYLSGTVLIVLGLIRLA
jgi:putative sporulation protein YtaF